MSRARAGFALAAVLVLTVMVVAGMSRQAEGSHVPIGVAAIDTNVAGNGATTLGPTEPCAQIAAVGQTRQIDLVLKSVPSEGLAAAAFDLAYDPTKIRITAFNEDFMMGPGENSLPFLADPLPDADGSFRLEIVDLLVPDPPAPPGWATGDGVLVRFTVEAVGSGSTSVYLSDAIEGDQMPNFLDPPPEAAPYQVAMMSSGQIAVGPTTCADPTPTPSPTPTLVPTPPAWDPPVKKLNGWTWYKNPNGLTTSYWFSCGASDADCRSRWIAPYDQSMTDWNSRPTGVRLTRTTDEVQTADIEIHAEVSLDALGPSILGIAQGYNQAGAPCSNCVIHTGVVSVDDSGHTGPNYGSLEQRRATVAHETGHLLALAHESVSEQCGVDGGEIIPHSVMAYDCINPVSIGGEGEVWVQDFDVCGVNQKYPSSFGDAGCLDQPTVASYFHSLPPCRLLDTRDGTGAPVGKLGPGQTMNLQVAERCGVEQAALVSAVVLNVTVTGPTSSSVLTVYPSDSSRPLTSNLNFVGGDTRPNAVTVKMGSDGKVKIWNLTGQTHVVADVFGYYGPAPTGGTRYNALSPARIMDTRTGLNGVVGKFGQGQTTTFQVTGKDGVPATGVDSVVLNVTVTEPTAGSFLTLYPANLGSRPNSSNLNFVAGQTVPNLVTAKLSPDGKVKIFNFAGATHVIMDVAGWYTTGASGQLFHAVTPARALDTRVGTGGQTGKLGQGAEMALKVSSVGGLPPSGASAVVMNGTVTGPTASSFLTLYPANEPRPNPGSNLNFVPNQTVPNAAISKVSPDGRIKIYNFAGSTHTIVDIAGWFGP